MSRPYERTPPSGHLPIGTDAPTGQGRRPADRRMVANVSADEA
ncbi:hypothetical protein WKI68_23285 [Streptomyces sp. MS1.HAVA.3]|uniref:Uncharacterized protein n=1 Tax=Streptomyces caledonius TaxID=3134107 RepID=A0ABU8U6K6_9ACTN